MVFAVAALLFQLGPAMQPLPDAALAPVAAAEAAHSTSVQPDPVATAPDHGSSDSAASASLTTASLDTSSQNLQSLSTIRLPEPPPANPVGVIGVQSFPSRRNWVILSAVQHGAAAFDAYSTRRAVSRGAVEGNPLMRPFAHSPGIYAAIQVGPVVLDLVARRMQRSHNNFLRHTWWLPQSASTGLFIFSGVHNLRVANHP
jgi:hypothetical protein